MPLANIIDNRKRKYRAYPMNAIMEPSFHDNEQPNADQYDPNDQRINIAYKQLSDTSVYLAVNWANRYEFPVALFLYDIEINEEERKEVDKGLSEFVGELKRSFKDNEQT